MVQDRGGKHFSRKCVCIWVLAERSWKKSRSTAQSKTCSCFTHIWHVYRTYKMHQTKKIHGTLILNLVTAARLCSMLERFSRVSRKWCLVKVMELAKMAKLMALIRDKILANFNWKPFGELFARNRKKDPNYDMWIWWLVKAIDYWENGFYCVALK